jgi:hypothetical protein
MRISGFSMARNAGKLYYPLRQAVMSILPVVDEFVVAVGDCDEDDTTREDLLSIGDSKVKIIDTVWDIEKYPRGTEHAHQTDIAMQHCSGDWLFYLQSDEVVHEKYLAHIREQCKLWLEDQRVEGFLFKYRHFWGDYDHYQDSHCWYRREIRIVRNDPEIHSWESAQSFRRIPDFDGLSYRRQEGTRKLRVVELDARIHHYGWVRPPALMSSKIRAMNTTHHGKAAAGDTEGTGPGQDLYDYGSLDRLPVFRDTHPSVMKEWIDRFDWQHQLRYSGGISRNRPRAKHDRLKYRIISFLEKRLFFGRRLGEFRNYVKIPQSGRRTG